MNPLFPGVYIEELSGGVRPIAGAGTSTAAFVGMTKQGPGDRAVPVTSFKEFQANFGTFFKGGWLPYAALNFFTNGGSRLYIARVTGHKRFAPRESDFQKAFALLDPIADLNLVAVPGVGTPSMLGFGADYCAKRRDCFFIGDMSLADDTAAKAKACVDAIVDKTSHAAVYLPWLTMKDPSSVTPGHPVAVPPSGCVAGIYARTDATRGVWKAPGGVEAVIKGTIGPVATFSESDHDLLNPLGANLIKTLPGSGTVLWGARTLATLSDPEYRYVPVRRTAIFIEESITQGTEWAVFEPNNETLWAQIRSNVEAFMQGLFRQGAFQGSSAHQAYMVKCDRETTTQHDIDHGRVNILVGFAPLKPAEFIVLRISQKTGPA